MPFTARMERPQLHCGGSASKNGTWPLPFYNLHKLLPIDTSIA
jgi:hypothetical protein